MENLNFIEHISGVTSGLGGLGRRAKRGGTGDNCDMEQQLSVNRPLSPSICHITSSTYLNLRHFNLRKLSLKITKCGTGCVKRKVLPSFILTSFIRNVYVWKVVSVELRIVTRRSYYIQRIFFLWFNIREMGYIKIVDYTIRR